MGGFLLERGGGHPGVGAAREVFRRMQLPEGECLERDGFVLRLYRKRVTPGQQIVADPDGSFAACAGTLLYDGHHGGAALQRLLADEKANGVRWRLLSGNYVLLLFHAGTLRVASDAVGLYPVYCDSQRRILSSSFLAVAEAAGSRTPNPQEIYEYVFTAGCYGNRTPLREVERIDSLRIWTLLPEIGSVDWPRAEPLPADDLPGSLERVVGELRDYFISIRGGFGDPVALPISGGYDSRLLLALARDVGIQPYLYVYGDRSHPDVRVAHAVARALGLSLDHRDRDRPPAPDPATFAARVRDNAWILDGLGHESGIWDDGRDLESRLDRAARTKLHLNGGGGESWRNFWALPERGAGLRDLIRTHFDSADFSIGGESFDRDEYLERLVGKAAAIAGRPGTREGLEILYPLLRVRYWQSKNNALNNRLGPSLTPFSEARFAIPASGIPLAWKNHGRFEAALITRLDAELARQASAYGHDFERGPSRLHRALTRGRFLAPPAAVSWAKRLRAKRRARGRRPVALTEPYVRELLGDGELAIRDYLDPSRTNDRGILTRAYTIELLLRGAIA